MIVRHSVSSKLCRVFSAFSSTTKNEASINPGRGVTLQTSSRVLVENNQLSVAQSSVSTTVDAHGEQRFVPPQLNFYNCTDVYPYNNFGGSN